VEDTGYDGCRAACTVHAADFRANQCRFRCDACNQHPVSDDCRGHVRTVILQVCDGMAARVILLDERILVRQKRDRAGEICATGEVWVVFRM